MSDSDTTRRGDGVVIPLAGRRAEPAAGLIPTQREALMQDPPAGMPHPLAADVMSMESPARFFRGLGNGLWMSTLLFALIAGVLVMTRALG